MILGENKTQSLRKLLLRELDDKVLVENIFRTIEIYHQSHDDEIKVNWVSEWSNFHQVSPWFARISTSGQIIKRIYLDCSTEYKSSNKKLVQKCLQTNIKIGTVVEYVDGGNSKRSMHYYGIITKYGLFRLGEIEDSSTLNNFLITYCEEVLDKLTEEHELLSDVEEF